MSTHGTISTLTRSQTIDALEATPFDCVVIGGGIAGAGIALEATLRGLSVAVLEAEDFASGTSSRSSKLIHGGLRYLAMGDISLVRETALERREIVRLAPHLAERRWMLLPVSSRATLLKLRVGITAYEKLGAVASEDLHQNWSRTELAEHEPLVNRERFPHACIYREYVTDDARLVLANLRAAVGRGAQVLNHARVQAITLDRGRASGVEVRCGLEGRSFRVRAGAVINAAGPWLEAIRTLESAEAKPMLVLSKGVHVVLPAERLPLRSMLVMVASDRRSLFAIPRGPIVYVGTTDTQYAEGAEVWPKITSDDVSYLLEPLGRYLTVDPIQPKEVVAAWSGLRPLIAEPGKRMHEISRRNEVLIGPAGVVSIAGGKLTGYRPMARRAISEVAKLLGRTLAPRTPVHRLPGGDLEGTLEQVTASLAQEIGVPEPVALRLTRLYGSEAARVAALGSEPLAPGTTVLVGEVEWAITQEGAARVEDVLYRRTRAALYEPAEREAVLQPMAERMQQLLEWTPERTEQELTRVRALLVSELAFMSPAA